MTMYGPYRELICDGCGNADYHIGSIEYANRQAKRDGWISYVKNGRRLHFESKECEKMYKNKAEST